MNSVFLFISVINYYYYWVFIKLSFFSAFTVTYSNKQMMFYVLISRFILLPFYFFPFFRCVIELFISFSMKLVAFFCTNANHSAIMCNCEWNIFCQQPINCNKHISSHFHFFTYVRAQRGKTVVFHLILSGSIYKYIIIIKFSGYSVEITTATIFVFIFYGKLFSIQRKITGILSKYIIVQMFTTLLQFR